MREKILYGIWACLYIVCVGLGFVPEPAGFGKVLLVLTALIFFLPGFVLLYDSRGSGKKRLRLRIISLCSLVLTLALLIANMCSALYPPQVGKVLYELLALVSAPMLCAQYWLLSLFLWAFLFVGTMAAPRKK